MKNWPRKNLFLIFLTILGRKIVLRHFFGYAVRDQNLPVQKLGYSSIVPWCVCPYPLKIWIILIFAFILTAVTVALIIAFTVTDSYNNQTNAEAMVMEIRKIKNITTDIQEFKNSTHNFLKFYPSTLGISNFVQFLDGMRDLEDVCQIHGVC